MNSFSSNRWGSNMDSEGIKTFSLFMESLDEIQLVYRTASSRSVESQLQ